jgi:hypothetical protein
MEGAEPPVLLRQLGLEPGEEIDQPVGHRRLGSGTVAQGVLDGHLGPDDAPVSDGDGVPPARLQDDQLVRCGAGGDLARAPGVPLLVDASHHGEARLAAGLAQGRGDGGGQRSLGVHRAAADDPSVVAPGADAPGNGVEMTEQHHLVGTVPPGGDDASGGVDLRREAEAAQPLAQGRRQAPLAAGGAGDGE